jgi:DNA polymerase III subunit chi
VGSVLFYHLTQSPLETTVRALLIRSYGLGWRVVVRSPSLERLDFLDRALWLGPEDEFLPHGRGGGSHDADQPILLTERPDVPSQINALMALDGASVMTEEIAKLERVWILFDGGDEAALNRAREQWRLFSEIGVGAQYWSEDGGRWTMKMERAASEQATRASDQR